MRKNNITVVVLFLAFTAVMFVLGFNVFMVSVFGVHMNSGVNIRNYANNISQHVETLTARRGFIYDRNKDIIAQDVDHYNVFAILNKDIPSTPGKVAYVDDKQKTAELLAPILGMTYEECLGYMKSTAYQVEFGSKGRGLTQIKKDEIDALQLNGIGFIRNSGRVYPNGTFASHLIGFAQYDSEKQLMIGKMGLEASLNSYLQGTDGKVEYQQDVNGYVLPGTKRNELPPVNGNDVYLTLDTTIQMYLEDGLEATMEKFKPKATWAVVMEVKTGKILGYASYPSFNPNVKDIGSYIDVPIGYAFEPGSTMKAFLIAAAMDTNTYRGELTLKTGLFHVGIKDGKFVRLQSKADKGYIGTVQDFNKGQGWGDISYDEGLIRSSNTAMVSLLVNQVGTKTYRDYLDRFHFFQATNFEATGETIGTINYEYGMEKITTSYGQGLTVNTIQLLQAYTAIFGNGEMIRPYIIDSIRNPYTEEVVYQGKREVIDTPISESTAYKMRELLTEVVQDGTKGSARFYSIPEVQMAGKTGTAEIAGDGNYLSGAGNNLYSIVLAAPAQDPEIMIFYAIQQPNTKSVHDNTNNFKDIFRNTLLYLNINDSEELDKLVEDKTVLYEQAILDQYTNMPIQDAVQQVTSKGFEVQIIGDGSHVMKQFPLASQTALTSQRVFLYTGHKIEMPDMIGWSRKDVMAFWNLCGISVESSGEGYVVEQNIKAGDYLSPDDIIQVVFQFQEQTTSTVTSPNQGG